MRPIKRLAFSAAILGGISSSLVEPTNADDLPRKPGLGAAIAPAEGGGVRIEKVLPEGSAEAAGLKEGDVLASFDGRPVASTAEVIRAIASHKSGDALPAKVRRGEEEIDVEVRLKERPREAGDGYEVEYGSVESRGARLRTIVTKPTSDGKKPALLVIQGLGAFSVDNPIGPLAPYRLIPAALTKAGCVTMRVEKPGVGDSEGGPCPDIDFETELDGYRQALKALKARPDVDPENVYLFGHSMGGIMGPLLAEEIPVRGVVAYGTALKPWHEYLLENTRRQMLLSGAPHSAADRANRVLARFMHHFAVEKLTPTQVAEKHPDLAEYVSESYPDGIHQFNRHYRFFQQLHDLDLSEHWEKVDAHVLAVWGGSDFVSSGEDHSAIADVINAAHPGHGTYLALEGSDHGFSRVESQKASQQGAAFEYNPAFAEALVAWIEKTRDKD